MKNLKDLTEDQLMEMHTEALFEISYHTAEIKHLETHINEAVETMQAVDEEMDSRQNGPKLKPVNN